MYQISYNCTREKSSFCCIITLKAFKSHTVYCMISLILHSRRGNNKQINECQGSECEGTRWPQSVTRDSPEVRELFCSWLLRGLPDCRCQYLRVYKGGDNLNKELYFYSLLKNFKDLFLMYMYVCLPASTCVHHVCVWCPWRPEESSGSPGTELQAVVSQYVGIGNPTWVLWKSSKCS